MKKLPLKPALIIIFALAIGSVYLFSTQKPLQKTAQEARKSDSKSSNIEPTLQTQTAPTSPVITAKPTPTPTKGLDLSGNSSVKLESITPSSAINNQSIVLRGYGFGPKPGYVIFYNSSGMASGSPSIDSWTDNEIHTKVYFVRGGQFYLAVRTAGGPESNKVAFTVSAGQPYISSINPYPNVSKSTQITISGAEFGSSGSVDLYSAADYEANILKGQATINSWTDTEIKFMVPSSLDTKEYGLQIKTSDGRTSSYKYITVSN